MLFQNKADVFLENKGQLILFIFILIFSLFFRIVFYSGAFGSDDEEYVASALRVLHGDWHVSSYIGDLRYGMNIGNAIFLYIFGVNEISINILGFASSLLEIAIVWIFVNKYLNFKVAMYTAFLMAISPLHVHYAGRIYADPFLSVCMTTSFLLCLHAAFSKRYIYYFLSGILAGLTFFIKEGVIFYIVLFIPIFIYLRAPIMGYVYFAVGGFLMLFLNLVLFYIIANDPFYIFQIVRRTVDSVYIGNSLKQKPFYFYMISLLHPVRFVFIPILSCFSFYFLMKSKEKSKETEVLTFVFIWFIGLFMLFSFLPISLNPLTFIDKQQNYALIFVSPLCILAGYFLSMIMNRISYGILIFLMVLAVFSNAIQQQAIKIFTSNSKFLIAYAREHQDVDFYVNNKNINIYSFYKNILWQGNEISNLYMYDDQALKWVESCGYDLSNEKLKRPAFVVFDEETMADSRYNQLPYKKCLEKMDILYREPNDTLGVRIIRLYSKVFDVFPESIREKITSKFDQYLLPKPIYILKIQNVR